MDIPIEIVESCMGILIGILCGYIMDLRLQRRQLKKSHEELLSLYRETRDAHQADHRDYEKWHQEQLKFILTCQAQIQQKNDTINELKNQLNALKQVHLN